MKRYFLKNGKEVKLGDTLVCKKSKSVGETTEVHYSLTHITEDSLKKLVAEKVIMESDNVESTRPLDIFYYIGKVAKKFHLNDKDMSTLLEHITDVYPIAAASLILREIALELDSKYKDNIKNSPEIYSVSAINGTIVKIDKADIKTFRNFAAFRTLQDARYACRIMRPIFKEIFSDKNGKK